VARETTVGALDPNKLPSPNCLHAGTFGGEGALVQGVGSRTREIVRGHPPEEE